MRFSDLLHPPGDKVSLGEMAEIKRLLPARITKTIPYCMYTDEKRFDYEVVIILAWIIARREQPEITEKEVGNQIGVKEWGHFEQVEKEILYFYTRHTRDEINKQFEDADARLKEVEEELKKVEEELEQNADVTLSKLDSSDEVSDNLEDQEEKKEPVLIDQPGPKE